MKQVYDVNYVKNALLPTALTSRQYIEAYKFPKRKVTLIWRLWERQSSNLYFLQTVPGALVSRKLLFPDCGLYFQST
jgi:hypothetical protein